MQSEKLQTQAILSMREAQQVVFRLRGECERIGLTNGCFDILHSGHLESLNYAKSLADCLIVAVNSDESVKKLKGDKRPIFPIDIRSQLVAALKPVDYVVVFNESTAASVVDALRPDVYVKSADYDVSETVEGRLVLSYGGTVHTSPLIRDISTTSVIQKIISTYNTGGVSALSS